MVSLERSWGVCSLLVPSEHLSKPSLYMYNVGVVEQPHYMNDFLAITIFTATCVLTPITIILGAYLLAAACTKTQPILTNLFRSNR